MSKAATRYLIPQFSLAHFSHHVSTGSLVPLLPLLRDTFELNYFQSGILVASFSLSYGIGQIPMSILADRYSRRLLVVVGLISTSLTGIALSLTHAFWQMIPCFVAMGVMGGTYHAPASSFISQVIPPERRGRALGLHVVGGSASFLLTPAMALGIATLFNSWRYSFLLLALPALIVSVLLWMTTEEHREDTEAAALAGGGPAKAPDNPRRNQAELEPAPPSWTEIARAVGILVGLSMLMAAAFASVNSYLPLYMVDHHNISPKLAGIVVSLVAGAGIIGAPLGGALSDRIGRKEMILVTLALSGPCLFLVTKAPYGILLPLALVFYGLAISARMPTMESFIADVVPVRRRTTVMGVYFFLAMETAGVATPLVGRLIDAYGLDSVFTILPVGLFVVAMVALLFRKHL